MIKVEKLEVWGFEHAIRGMRNPMNSWDRSDSVCEDKFTTVANGVNLGPNDLELMKKLFVGGTEHRKFMRQIFISLDITAPLYWWKEFDTYKVGTTSNSCSTMHKIHAKEFELDDFSHEHLTNQSVETILLPLIQYLNDHRMTYLTTNTNVNRNARQLSDGACESIKKDIWWQMIQLLPSSYNQKRTITMTYENAAAICKQRQNHKLDEWCALVYIFYNDLPYFKQIYNQFERNEK